MANKEVFPDGTGKPTEDVPTPQALKPRQLGFLQALWRAVIYTPCDHDWELKVDRILEPSITLHGAATFRGFDDALFMRRHVTTLVCRSCGKLFHRISP